MSIVICKDSTELNARAADVITDLAQKAIAARGRFTIALAGGSTPEDTYALLAQEPRATRIDWQRIFVFMSDERCVPFDDKRSNFGEAWRNLIGKVPLPAANKLPIPTNAGTPDQIAALYSKMLAEFFGTEEGASPPVFDLILLGLGDDGHCASLFPGKPTLEETKRWVVSSPPGTLPPPVDRVTFTLPLINAARAVMFLVGGAKKAPAVQDVLEESPPVTKRPSAGVHPTNGTLTWLLDEDAASRLSPQTRSQ